MFVISCKNTTNCFNGLIFLYISNDALEYWFTKFAFCCVLPIFLFLILKVLLPLMVDLYIIMNLGTMYRQFHLSVFQQSSLHDVLEKWCKESFHSVAFSSSIWLHHIELSFYCLLPRLLLLILNV